MRDTIDMAREAGLEGMTEHPALQRLVELARADEREAFARIQFESILQAIKIEREACAKYAENHDLGTPDGHDIAAAIRARGNT